MAARPCRNSERLRQRLSVVYARATRAGSRVFQASSAMRAFCAAVSAVNGGSGGRLTESKRLERDDRPRVLDARDHLNLLIDEMTDVDTGVDIDLHQQIEFTRGRIDLRGNFRVGQAVGHLVGLAELAFDLDEERNHGASAPNPAKSTASGKTATGRRSRRGAS